MEMIEDNEFGCNEYEEETENEEYQHQHDDIQQNEKLEVTPDSLQEPPVENPLLLTTDNVASMVCEAMKHMTNKKVSFNCTYRYMVLYSLLFF